MNKEHEAVFQAIEETRPILKDDWQKYWELVLKKEIIEAYLKWVEEQKEIEHPPFP
jgi:hypothetical protein